MSRDNPLYVRVREPMTPAESSRRAAEARWGPKRRLNIGDLSPEQRRVVLALVEAQRAANRAAGAGEDAA